MSHTALDTSETRALLQQRVALVGKVVMVLFGVPLGAQLVYFLVRGQAAAALTLQSLLSWLSVACAVVTWLACRRGERSFRVVKILDALGYLVACVVVVLMSPIVSRQVLDESVARLGAAGIGAPVLGELAGFVQMGVVVAIMVGLLLISALRAAVIPYSVQRTAALTAVVAVPLVLVAGLDLHPFGASATLERHSCGWARAPVLGHIAAWWTLGTIVCAVISKVIFNLRREVRHALQLGQYTLERKLGEGGMGVVYRARHALMRRPTAVKLLPAERSSEASLRRFEREVQLTAKLSHPNTITVYDYGRTPEGVLYYAMELLDGATLQAIVDCDGAQPPARVVRVLEMVAGALVEAHGIGLIHRDIKPANIFLCRQGGELDVAKVLDFGLVKALTATEDAALTREGVIAGTPLYMPPEAITDPAEVDERSDLYAVGAVGYFLLTGTNVFEGKTTVEVCGHHLHAPVVPPSERLGRSLPAALERLVVRCLAKKPSDRPQSALALRHELRACRLALAGAGDDWAQEQAQAWWERQGSKLRPAAEATLPTELASTIAVDLARGRTAPAA